MTDSGEVISGQLEVAALSEVELTRGAKGEYRWSIKSSAMDWEDACHRVVMADLRLRDVFYPGELPKNQEGGKDAGI